MICVLSSLSSSSARGRLKRMRDRNSIPREKKIKRKDTRARTKILLFFSGSMLAQAIDRGRIQKACYILHDAPDAEAQLLALSNNRLRKLLHRLRTREHWCMPRCTIDHHDTFLSRTLHYDVWFCTRAVCPLLLAIALHRDDLLPELVQHGQQDGQQDGHHLHRGWGLIDAANFLWGYAPRNRFPSERRIALVNRLWPCLSGRERGDAVVRLLEQTEGSETDIRVFQVMLDSTLVPVPDLLRAVDIAVAHNLRRMLRALLDVPAATEFSWTDVTFYLLSYSGEMETVRETVQILMDAGSARWRGPLSSIPRALVVETFFEDMFRSGIATVRCDLNAVLPRDLAGVVLVYARGLRA